MPPVVMMVRVVLARPLVVVLLGEFASAAAFLVMALALALPAWGAVSVVGMVMVGAAAVLVLTCLSCPLVLIPGWFMKVWWRAGIQWRMGLSIRRCGVHFRNSLSPDDGAIAVVVCNKQVIISKIKTKYA